jgi:hypothetical protein
LEKIVANAYEASVEKYNSFINELQNNLDIIRHNKQELMQQLYPENTPTQENPGESYQEEENFSEAES